MNFIEESLEAICKVAEVSRGLKGSLCKRLRTATAIIRGSSIEIQRRLCTKEREVPEPERLAAALKEQQWKVVQAEIKIQSLEKELKRENTLRLTEAEKMRDWIPHPPSQVEMGMEMEIEMTGGERTKSLSPLSQRSTRSKGRTRAEKSKKEREGRESKWAQTTVPSSSSRLDWPEER